MKLLNNSTLTDIRGKIINTKDVKIKIIQKILNKKSIPKCQDKWNNVYNEEFHWPKIWNNLKRLDISVMYIIIFIFLRTLSSLYGIHFLILEYSEIQFLVT
jgi:hypothetical protein